MKSSKTLKENAMLVALNISQWTGSKTDKKVTMEIEETKNAHESGRFTKKLVDSSALKKLRMAVNDIRKFYYKVTLPWDDNGHRLLRNTEYFNFCSEFGALKAEFEKEVNAFLENYDTYVLAAKKNLGDMYQETDYPNRDDLRCKFGIGFSINEITAEDDLRVKVNEEQIEDLKQSIRADIETGIQIANGDIFSRVKEVVGKMISRLSEEAPEFRDSLVENVRELVFLIPRLNFTGDQAIDAMAKEMEALLIDPDQLRDSAELREKTVSEAERILSKYIS